MECIKVFPRFMYLLIPRQVSTPNRRGGSNVSRMPLYDIYFYSISVLAPTVLLYYQSYTAMPIPPF